LRQPALNATAIFQGARSPISFHAGKTLKFFGGCPKMKKPVSFRASASPFTNSRCFLAALTFAHRTFAQRALAAALIFALTAPLIVNFFLAGLATTAVFVGVAAG